MENERERNRKTNRYKYEKISAREKRERDK